MKPLPPPKINASRVVFKELLYIFVKKITSTPTRYEQSRKKK